MAKFSRTTVKAIAVLLAISASLGSLTVWLYPEVESAIYSHYPPPPPPVDPLHPQRPPPTPAGEKRRIALLKAIDAEFGVPYIDPRDEANRQTIRGTIKTADGSPLPADLTVDVRVRGTRPDGVHRPGRVTQCTTRPSGDGQFEITTKFGYLWLTINHPEFAPQSVGPILTVPGQPVKQNLILKRGFTAKVHVTNPDGKPIGGVHVAEMSVYASEGWRMRSTPPSLVSNADGEIFVPHCAAFPTRIRLALDQFIDPIADLDPWNPFLPSPWREGQPIEHGIAPSMPVTGRVFHADGTPAASAKLYLSGGDINNLLTGVSTISRFAEPLPVPVATTDQRGDFRILSLRKRGTYNLLTRAPDGSRLIVPGVVAGTTGLTMKLIRPSTLRGKLTGRLESLARVSGKPTILYAYNDWEIGKHYPVSSGVLTSSFSNGPDPTTPLEVNISDGVGRFQIPELFHGQLVLDVAGNRSWHRVDGKDLDVELPIHPVSSDGSTGHSVPMKEVSAELEQPTGCEQAIGTITFIASWDFEAPETWSSWGERVVAVRSGLVKQSFPSPNNHVQIFPDGLVGYTFDPPTISDNTPFRPKLRLRPAGMIYGAIGRLPPGGRIYAQPHANAEQPDGSSMRRYPRGSGLGLINEAKNTYIIHAVALDTQMNIVADGWFGGRSRTVILAENILLTDEKPAYRLDIPTSKLAELMP